MEEARDLALATNSYVFMAYFRAHHVGSLAAAGCFEQAAKTRSEVIAIMRERSESWANAETHRMLADAERARPGGDEAAGEDYLRALSVARDQNAKLWELRAATGLAHLLCDQGKSGEARDLLAPVYNWFTEGFETSDLIDAKAPLDELS